MEEIGHLQPTLGALVSLVLQALLCSSLFFRFPFSFFFVPLLAVVAVVVMSCCRCRFGTIRYRWIDYQFVDEATEREHIKKAVEITEKVRTNTRITLSLRPAALLPLHSRRRASVFWQSKTVRTPKSARLRSSVPLSPPNKLGSSLDFCSSASLSAGRDRQFPILALDPVIYHMPRRRREEW